MKKLFKKSIACLIAVLMVISALPFSPLSSPIEANAAEVKTNIDVWAASRATANTASGDRYSYKDSITEKTISGIQWGSLTHNSTYLTVSNTALSFAEISNSGAITGNDNITDLGISGNKWSFSAKFAYTGSATKTTVFGLASTTKRNYTQKNTGGSPEISNGYVADLVDIRANGDVYLNDTWTSKVSGISSDDLASSSATSPKTLTVTYDNGNLTIDIDGTQKISERVNTDLFSAGVGNYIAGPNVQVFAGANSGIYPHYQVTNNGDYLYNMNLYSLSGATYEESAQYVKANVESFEGYTGTVTQSSDTADGYNATNFWNIPASGIEDKMSNVLYAKGCVNAPFTTNYLEFTAHSKKTLWWTDTYTMKCGGLQYGDMVFLYDDVNDCANIVMSYASSDAAEGGMTNLEPITSGFSIKSNWHSNGNRTDKSYTNKRNWAFGPVNSTIIKMGDDNNETRYFYNTLYYTGTPTQTITTVQNITWKATMYSTNSSYNGQTGQNTFGNTNNTNGTTTVYVVNYKPIKDKVSAIKSTYEKVKAAGDAAYCANSLGAYYRAVEKVLKLNPNSYPYSTNLSYAVTKVGEDIDDVVNNYLTTATTEPTKHTRKTVREKENAATCTAPGSYEEVVKCSKCNVEISRTPKTTPALGHSFTNYVRTVAPTCTKVGTETATCERCDVTDTRDVAIDESAHKWGNWTKVDSTNHRRVCEYNNDHTQTEAHDMDGNTCRKCDYIAKVTITFVDKDGNSKSTDYAIGADIVIPDLPNPNPVYTPNGDGATHTKVTYAWDVQPDAIAQKTATYRVVPTTDNDDACQFGVTPARTDVIIEGKTYDIFTCTLCNGEKKVRVADKDALNEAILQLQNDLDLPEAGYKYDAALVEAARNLINEANALGRYADQAVVDAKVRELKTAKNELNAAENLAKYTITVQVVNSEDEKDEVVKGLGGTYTDIPYGETFTHNVNIPIINDGSSLSGLPKYAVYKWMVGDVKLNTADTSISGVVKGNATYICYVLNFKASTDVGGVPTTTRVRYLDKSGHTVDFDRATIGQPYKRKDTSKAPVIPYYTCTGWEPVFGDESNVGTRELVYKPIYTYKDSLANKCEIVGLNGVKVNGEASYQAIYDERIELSGADMFAYADENGNIIARINANYIYAPHIYGVSKTIYITKVETATEKAETIITGTFTTKDDPKYNYLVVNAQFYLPEGATAVESGIVIGKQNDANVLKIGSATKVVSTSQGDNHEYSIQMSYSKNKTGTLYARSYLIYVDSNGDTQTVYSDDITTCNLD